MNQDQQFIDTVRAEFEEWYFKEINSPSWHVSIEDIRERSIQYEEMFTSHLARAQKDRKVIEQAKSLKENCDTLLRHKEIELAQKDEEIELHLSNFRFVNKKSIELNTLLADTEKELAQAREEIEVYRRHTDALYIAAKNECDKLKEELKREREDWQQTILWIKSGNVQIDDIVADIEREKAQRGLNVK